MGFEIRGEAVLAAHSLDELKLVYRVLHRHLSQHPEMMDTHFLIELQRFLHNCAKQDGVDISDHGAWDAWVGNESGPSCEVRMGARRQIDPA